MKRARLWSLAALFLLSFGASSGVPAVAHADIITPEQQLLRAFGITRPSRYSDPRFLCRREASEKTAKKQPGASVSAKSGESAAFKAAYDACIKGKEAEVKAFDARHARYDTLSSIFFLIVFGLLPLLVIASLFRFVRRRKQRISEMEDAPMPTPEDDEA